MKITLNKTPVAYWLPLLAIATGLFLFLYFHLYQYLTFQAIKDHELILSAWTNSHYILAVCFYLILYVTALALSIPSNFIFAVMGGILFGFWQGVSYAVLCATTGSTLIFLIIKMSLAEVFRKKVSLWVIKMEKGFQQNALNYILALRLVPVFPFWLVNIVSALLRVRTSDFVLGTFFGVIPSTMVYVSLGCHFNQWMVRDKVMSFSTVFQPGMILSLAGLCLLALMPVCYRRLKAKERL